MSGAIGARLLQSASAGLGREPTKAQVDQLRRLVELTADEPAAPTAVKDEARILDIHIADSLAALALAPARTARRIVDIGSGGGFPGLPLAIMLPDADVALLESNGRKAAYLARTIEALGLDNATVVAERAELWRDGIGRRDLAAVRALAPMPVVAEYAAPLLAPCGSLVDWRGAVAAEELAAARRAAALLGLELPQEHRYTPYKGAHRLRLYVYSKISDTPPRFPRRPGIARKRPLGA